MAIAQNAALRLERACRTLQDGAVFLGSGLGGRWGQLIEGPSRGKLLGNGLRELDRFLNLLLGEVAATCCDEADRVRFDGFRNTALKLESLALLLDRPVPELPRLRAMVSDPVETRINGVAFVTGRIEGRAVLLFLSGVSMVNAAMTTQLALDRFHVRRIVFSGVAGGVDPALTIGDVAVPERWGQYLEATFARAEGTSFAPVARGDGHPPETFANYGMIYPVATSISRVGATEPEQRFWFEADPAMLAIARGVAARLTLQACVDRQCLAKPPRIVVGGNGVSGAAFVDNADFRLWARATFKAEVLDMESAAVAHVAYANGVPFLAFRSLSDLAGGDGAANQARTFYRLASANSAEVVRAFVAALPGD